MSYKTITNIKHLMPDDLTLEMPAAALKLHDFLGGVIKVATARSDSDWVSALPCRLKFCRGIIEIKRQDLPQRTIFWHCSHCDDGGAISNWEKTYFDLTARTKKQSDEEDPELEIFVTSDELAALRANSVFDPDCERMVYGALSTPKGILMRGLESDFDNFVGFLAAEANHETKVKRRKFLDAVYERASGALDDSIFR